MYFTIALLLATVVPFPTISRGIARGERGYEVVARGITAGTIGAFLVLAVVAAMGVPISENLSAISGEAAKSIASNSSFVDLMGLGDMSKNEQLTQITKMYETYFMLIPCSLIIWSAIASFLEYKLVRKSLTKIEEFKSIPKLYIRDFDISNIAIICWFLIYVASYIMMISSSNGALGNAVYMNVSLLFRLLFAFQGISTFFYIFDMKKLPKAIPVIIAVLGMSQPIGITFLFIVGIIDATFGLKKRIAHD